MVRPTVVTSAPGYPGIFDNCFGSVQSGSALLPRFARSNGGGETQTATRPGHRRKALPFTEGPKPTCQGEPDARVPNNLMASLVARMAVPNAMPRSSRLGLNAPSPVPSA